MVFKALLKNFQDLQTEDNCKIACRRRATAKHGDHRKHCSRIFKTCRRRITAKSLADGGQLQKTGITDQRNIAFRFYRIKVRSTLGNFSTSSSNPTNMMRTPSWMDSTLGIYLGQLQHFVVKPNEYDDERHR